MEKKQPSADKLKALQLAMQKIDKDFGKGAIMKLGDDKIEDVPVISTGSVSLNMALGVGGKTKEYGNERLDIPRDSHDSFDQFNRFDGGLRIGCGAEYQMVYAEMGFDFGLANISDDEWISARNQSFFINVGVNF